MKTATEYNFAGPHMTGPRDVQIVACDADGRNPVVQKFRAANKAESLAIAKRERAAFTV
jgi:hypothetical protein